MFEEVQSEIELKLGIGIDEELLDILENHVQENLDSLVSESSDKLTAEFSEEFITETVMEPWTIKYPTRDLYGTIEERTEEADLNADPYTIGYVNRLYTSIVADLLYSSAVVAKKNGYEQLSFDTAEETCTEVLEKSFIC